MLHSLKPNSLRWASSSFQGHRRPSRAVRCIARSTLSASDYKRSAAALFVNTYVHSNMTLGLGTGELCNLCVEEVGRRIAAGNLSGVTGIPSSDQAAATAAFHGVPQPGGEERGQVVVDLAFDQVDQLDVEASACIMGVASEPQQPQLLRALTMAQAGARKLVVLVEEKQVVQRLSGTLPILIDHDTWEETAEEVDDIVIGDAEVWRRGVPGGETPDPRGGDAPYVSPEGHNILDVRYESELCLFGEPEPYHKIEDELMEVPGVVATGMLLGVAAAAVIASPKGPKIVELAVDLVAQAALQAPQSTPQEAPQAS